jgi:hypothetical protein
MVPMEAASLVMEAKMLHGIKTRAEHLASRADRGAERAHKVARL